MAHCVICKKDFASGNSLRSHRSRYHKVPKDLTDEEEDAQLSSQETTEKDSQQLKYDQNSQSTVEDQEDTDQEDTDQEDTDDDLHRDTLSSKRKHSETDEEKPSKNRHIYKRLSGIHNLLKNHLEDKVYGSLFCYSLKQELFDKRVPEYFDNEHKLSLGKKRMDFKSGK